MNDAESRLLELEQRYNELVEQFQDYITQNEKSQGKIGRAEDRSQEIADDLQMSL